MKKIYIILSISSILLSACGSSTSTSPSQPASTVTQVQISPPTATPANTSTPEPTATKEIKQYPICAVENYTECVIPYQDLFSGDYLNWLNTLPVEEFDASALDKIRCIGPSTGIMFAGGAPDQNYKDNAAVRLRRGVTVGTTSIKDGEVGYNFYGVREFVVLPTYAYSDSLKQGTWLILIFPYGGWSESQARGFIKEWNIDDELMVIANKYFSGIESANNTQDPMVVNTFKLIPDMQTRLDNFQASCDPAFISGPGIVLETAPTR